jgi:hypothetical protein
MDNDADKEAAKELMSLATSLDASLVQMFAIVRAFSDEELKNRYNKAVGDLMGYIARDLICPLVNKYPDLEPDK